MGIGKVNKAVFLDRDGVINKLIFNPSTGEYESPHYPEDLEIFEYAATALNKLQQHGYLLFLISNQPSFAKGKTTLENIKAIHARLHDYLLTNQIIFTEYYYCYHHPQGIISEYTCTCACRKPGAYFLEKAQAEYQLDMGKSWLVGDQDSDIFCGQAAKINTILLEEQCSEHKRGKSIPNFLCQDMLEAVDIILFNAS